MTATQAIRELLENRLREVDAEVANLRDALERLDREGAAPASGGRTRRARVAEPAAAADQSSKRARRPRRAKPDRRDGAVGSAQLQQLLGQSDRLSTAALAERAELGRDRGLMLLKELEARGEVRRTGQRRGVRWHAVTDEDRIRQRAAELERQSRTRRAAARPRQVLDVATPNARPEGAPAGTRTGPTVIPGYR